MFVICVWLFFLRGFTFYPMSLQETDTWRFKIKTRIKLLTLFPDSLQESQLQDGNGFSAEEMLIN